MIDDMPRIYLDNAATSFPKPEPVYAAIDRGLAEVVHKAMSREPADRYPDAAAFRRALLPFG